MSKRDISERHEIRIDGEKATFVFVADSADGKLVIRQLRKNGREKEVCALTLGDPRELEDFFEGLQRVLKAMGAPKPQPLIAEGTSVVTGAAGRRSAPSEARAQSPRTARQAESRGGGAPRSGRAARTGSARGAAAGGTNAQATLPLGAPGLPPAADDSEREQIIERARTRNPKAFEPWTREEEQEVRLRFRSGEQLEDIARSLSRSPRAVLMRLKRLGENVEGVAPMLQ